MPTTLLKFLMIAAVAPSMTLTQEPPTPPVAPRPAETPRAARPALPPRPAETPAPANWDFKYDLKLDISPKLEEMKYHLEKLHDVDMQHALDAVENLKVHIEPQVNLALENLKFDLNFQG